MSVGLFFSEGKPVKELLPVVRGNRGFPELDDFLFEFGNETSAFSVCAAFSVCDEIDSCGIAGATFLCSSFFRFFAATAVGRCLGSCAGGEYLSFMN